MKKIFCLFALLFAAWHSAAAYDFMVDGIAYNKSTTNKKAVEVAHLSYYAGRITIPPTVTYNNSYNEIEYFVTAIGDNAFMRCDKLTSISIPKTVTKIGNNAFMGCTGLNSISVDSNNPVYDSRNNCNAIIETSSNNLVVGCNRTVIPNTVTSIGDYAFVICPGLTSINIPASVTVIDDESFLGCCGLASITVDSNNPVFDSRNNCNAIIETETNYLYLGCKNTTIPNTVTYIVDNAFAGCTGLTEITLPESITKINSGAFDGCTNLTKVISLNTTPPDISRNEFPAAGVTVYVPASAVNAYRQDEYWMDYNIQPLGGIVNTEFEVDDIYYRITSDTTVEVIARFGGRLYSGNISIPSTVSYGGWTYNVTEIDDDAFYGCFELTSIYIPASVTTIEDDAIGVCPSLTSITVDSNNPVYDSRNNCNAIIETSSNVLLDGCMNTVIPNTVTRIYTRAFQGCSGLTSITIPESVTSIGSAAFAFCSGLTSITIPESITSIEFATFTDCSSLTDVTLSNSLVSIGEQAFSCCGITSIYIPESVTSIGYEAFFNCESLATVTSLNTTPPAAYYAFGFGDARDLDCVTVYVPASAVNAYRQAPGWKRLNIQALPSALPGDVDGDGVADITDINCITNVILGNEPASKYEGRADVNEDGNVDIDDLNIIIDTILGN